MAATIRGHVAKKAATIAKKAATGFGRFLHCSIVRPGAISNLFYSHPQRLSQFTTVISNTVISTTVRLRLPSFKLSHVGCALPVVRIHFGIP